MNAFARLANDKDVTVFLRRIGRLPCADAVGATEFTGGIALWMERQMLFVRTATIAPGRFAEAMAFSREISSYLKSKAGVDVRVFAQIGGVSGRIAWQAEFKSLAAYDQFLGQFVPDAGYQEIVKKAAPLFIAERTRDSLWIEPPHQR